MELNEPVTIQLETVGQAYLEVLRARGIFFSAIAARTLRQAEPEFQGSIERGELGGRNRANAILDTICVYGDNLVDLDK